MTKYAITGIAGFIGSKTAQYIASNSSNDVVGIDDLSAGNPDNLDGVRCSWVNDSIMRIDALRSLFKGVECVIHLAAVVSVQRSILHPIETSRIGIEGTLNVLEAARQAGVRKVVYASSAAIYGDTSKLPTPEDATPNPSSPYAITKLTGEAYCKLYQELYGLQTVCLRYFNVYGPKQVAASPYSGVISKFALAARLGEEPTIYGDGEQTRDFVYVGDVARANLLACHTGSGTYNIASGKGTSLNKLVKLMFPEGTEPLYLPARKGDIRHSLADVTKARKGLGYKDITPLATGLKESGFIA